MANDAGKVRIVPDGILYFGAVGATPPTSSVSTISGGWTEVGYYSEDGYSLTPDAPSPTDINAHNGDIVKTITDGNGSWSLQFGPIETSKTIVETYFDAAVNLATGSIEVKSAAVNTDRAIIAVALTDDGKRVVKHFPRVRVSEREGLTFNRSTLLMYGMTFKTYKDASVDYQFKVFDTLFLNS